MKLVKTQKRKGVVLYMIHIFIIYDLRKDGRNSLGEAKEEAENKVQLKTEILANKTFGG